MREGGFNPRARVGRDRTLCPRCEEREEFQSTRPRGARPIETIIIMEEEGGFNPRARVGRDL